MKALILYSSLTGNTEKIAKAIGEAMPIENEIHSVTESYNIEENDVIVMGYWVDKGTCDDNTKNIIEKLENKSIVLFGTTGAKDSGDYYENIKKRVEQIMPSNNKVLGHFLCQGKVDEKLTKRYEGILLQNPENEQIKEQLKNYYEASKHPNVDDERLAKDFICDIFNKL